MPASATRRRASSSRTASLSTTRALRAYVRAHHVVAFTKSYCPYCKRAVRTLRAYARRYGTTVRVVELDTMVPARKGEALQRRLARVTGRTTVPNVFIGGEAVGGGDEVEALRAERRLGRLVKTTVGTGRTTRKRTTSRVPAVAAEPTPSTLYLYHHTVDDYVADILKKGCLLPASKTRNQQQNPYSDRSPYVFFNVYAHKDLPYLMTSGIGVGLVFAIPDALIKHTIYTSSHHSGGEITREGVHKHVFRDRKSMLRVFRSLRSHSMRTAQRVVEDEESKPWADAEYDTAPMATAFQEVFSKYEMPITSLRYALLSKPDKRLETMVHKWVPHAKVNVHIQTERDFVQAAKLAVHTVKGEGLRWARSDAEDALKGLASCTSTEAKALRTQLQALLNKGPIAK